MKFDNLPEALTFDGVLLVPQYSSIISRDQPLDWKLGEYNFTTPVIAANMDTLCGEKMMKKMAQLGGLGIHHRYCSMETYWEISPWWRYKQGKLYPDVIDDNRGPLALSVGSLRKDKKRIDWCVDPDNCDIICVDIAHGDSIHMLDTLKYIRDKGFTGPVIAGNVCTPEATRFLLENGATIVKVGVGPGSVCTTRIKTGCGYPQLSAIANCAEAGPIIADGGIRTSGDAAKALAAGAKAIMIGGMLAGTDCVPGWDEAMGLYERELAIARQGFSGSEYPKQPHIVYRGMASKEARKDFGQEGTNAEGISKTVECKSAGSTEAVIMNIAEGIRSAMSYSGAYTLQEFSQRARFVRVGSDTQAENHPHFKG
jgi:IMP dehydrogenase